MIKLFFDECCSRRLSQKLLDTYKEDYGSITIVHLSDCVKEGTSDSDWIGMLSEDPSWIIVTADKGKNRKKEQLPTICEQLKVTHIILSSTILHKGYTFQKQCLLTLWPQIIRANQLKKGSRIQMSLRSYAGGSQWPVLTVNKIPFDRICPPDIS